MKKSKDGLAVFDFDGVFNTGSQPAYYDGYEIALSAVGSELSPEEQRLLIDENWGSSHKVIIGRVLASHPDFGSDPDLVSDAVDVFEDYMERTFAHRIEPVKGSSDMLGRLAGRYSLALNTGAPRNALLNSIMPSLDIEPTIFNAGIVTADQLSDNYTKPAPYVIGILMAQQRFAPEQTVMVGDSIADMESAKSAGVEPIAITGTGNMTPMTAKELGYVRYRLGDVTELEELLPKIMTQHELLGKVVLKDVTDTETGLLVNS
jgi:phosphoglycolate phosphatase-like HAD superfamily hydrolase